MTRVRVWDVSGVIIVVTLPFEPGIFRNVTPLHGEWHATPQPQTKCVSNVYYGESHGHTFNKGKATVRRLHAQCRCYRSCTCGKSSRRVRQRVHLFDETVRQQSVSSKVCFLSLKHSGTPVRNPTDSH